MNETKKELINILSEFMEKEFSRGCIYSYTRHNMLKEQTYYEEVQDWDTEIMLNYKEIIWHYDITAVLKYIHKKLFIEFYNEEIIHCEDVKWNKYNIPNKPLILYTEQEEVLLLELLLTLWKTTQ